MIYECIELSSLACALVLALAGVNACHIEPSIGVEQDVYRSHPPDPGRTRILSLPVLWHWVIAVTKSRKRVN